MTCKQQAPRSSNYLTARLARAAAGALALVAVAGAARSARADLTPAALEAKKIFNQRCTACHTYGKGVKVGPDLKGVTERRQRPWLLKFIRSSQTVILGGDPVAKTLFADFKQQRMPDWTDLSEAQITGILDWFAASGPEQKEPDERNAELATAAEIDRGRGLFHGGAKLANGGLSCATCHGITDGATKSSRGGTLGPDLTGSYLRYQDKALTLFFKRPCFRRAPESAPGKYLTPEESFGLKAYMRQAAFAARPGPSAASAALLTGDIK